MPPDIDQKYANLSRLLEKNADLLEENNELLKKIHRNGLIGFWFRIIWYALLIGLPFALYFYLLEPYFAALGSSYDIFSAGLQEIPGFKQFNEALQTYRKE